MFLWIFLMKFLNDRKLKWKKFELKICERYGICCCKWNSKAISDWLYFALLLLFGGSGTIGSFSNYAGHLVLVCPTVVWTYASRHGLGLLTVVWTCDDRYRVNIRAVVPTVVWTCDDRHTRRKDIVNNNINILLTIASDSSLITDCR